MSFLERYKESIDQEIVDYFSTFTGDSVLKEACLYALIPGGRRLRPIISLLVAESLQFSHKKAMPVALAVEFFHAASLIADDLPCMDNDLVRRGAPSTHAKFGEAVAILATYALIAEGYHLLSKAESTSVPLLIRETARATGLLGASQGQLLDLQPPDQELSTMEEMIKKKTGALFELSFLSGWIASGGDLELISRVRDAASHFGAAFQIYDDLEDLQDSNQTLINLAYRIGVDEAKLQFENHLMEFRSILKNLQLEDSLLFELPHFFPTQNFSYQTQ